MGNTDSFEIFQEGELEDDFRRGGGLGETSLWSLFQKGKKDMVNGLIRPKRKCYRIEALGPTNFEINSIMDDLKSKIKREDFIVKSESLEHELIGSRWVVCSSNDDESSTITKTPCILYLHSNMGCRLDALRIRNAALLAGFSVIAFDFSGCGHSEGKYVTGGEHESVEVKEVIEYIQREFFDGISQLFLYGHSMGAVAAILYYSKCCMDEIESDSNHISIEALILDAPYQSLKSVTEQMIKQIQHEGYPVPSWILRAGIRIIASSIEEEAKFQINDVCLKDRWKHCKIPALFLTGSKDKYVPTTSIDDMISSYGGQADRLRFDGDHYGLRPKEIIEFAVDFLQGTMERSVIKNEFKETQMES